MKIKPSLSKNTKLSLKVTIIFNKKEIELAKEIVKAHDLALERMESVHFFDNPLFRWFNRNIARTYTEEEKEQIYYLALSELIDIDRSGHKARVKKMVVHSKDMIEFYSKAMLLRLEKTNKIIFHMRLEQYDEFLKHIEREFPNLFLTGFSLMYFLTDECKNLHVNKIGSEPDTVDNIAYEIRRELESLHYSNKRFKDLLVEQRFKHVDILDNNHIFREELYFLKDSLSKRARKADMKMLDYVEDRIVIRRW